MQEWSGQSSLEHRSRSLATRAHPNGSPASQRDSVDSDEEDRMDEEYTPSVQSSARGKKSKLWSLSPEHSSKEPRNRPGSSTFGLVYQAKVPRGPSELGPSTFLYRVQAPGQSSKPIPTPTSWLVHPSPTVPVVRPLGPSLGVPQQPILVPVLGTVTHPLVLDQSALDQEYFDEEPLPMVSEQPRVDLDQYS
jgi:hypothetical protein